MVSLLENLEGPHEWGYRDPVEGGFVEDLAPFRAAEKIRELEQRVKELEAGPDWLKVEKITYSLDRAAEQFEFYREQHRNKVSQFEKSKSKDFEATHVSWDAQIKDTLTKAEVNDQMATMCRDALKEPLSRYMDPVSVEVRPEMNCQYEPKAPDSQGQSGQNYSTDNNLLLATRIVGIIAPHWDKTVRQAAAGTVRTFLDMELTRMWDDIQTFHHKFRLDYGGPPRLLPAELADFRVKFMQEELNEYRDTLSLIEVMGDTVERRADLLDALVDLVYVALGTAYLHGFNFAEAWRRVQRANVSKVRAERADQSKRGSTFDVVKPQGWRAPDHRDLVGIIYHSGGVVTQEVNYIIGEKPSESFLANAPSIEEIVKKHDLF